MKDPLKEIGEQLGEVKMMCAFTLDGDECDNEATEVVQLRPVTRGSVDSCAHCAREYRERNSPS